MGEPEHGRHYMTDESLLSYIVEQARVRKGDVALDIGAGTGALTLRLERLCRCIAVDNDPVAIGALKARAKKAEIISGDILRVLPGLKFTKVVSNIPYAISEPLFYQLAKKDFELGIMTIGARFYDVLTGDDAKKCVTKTSVIFRSRYDVKKLKDVERSAFTPRPRADSCVILVTRKESELMSGTDLVMARLLMLDNKKLKNGLDEVFRGKIPRRELAKTTSDAMYQKKLQSLSNEETAALVDAVGNLLMR